VQIQWSTFNCVRFVPWQRSVHMFLMDKGWFQFWRTPIHVLKQNFALVVLEVTGQTNNQVLRFQIRRAVLALTIKCSSANTKRLFLVLPDGSFQGQVMRLLLTTPNRPQDVGTLRAIIIKAFHWSVIGFHYLKTRVRRPPLKCSLFERPKAIIQIQRNE